MRSPYRRCLWITLSIGALSLARPEPGLGGGLSYQDRGTGKEPVEKLPGAPPPRYERYRTPIEARVVDRRFETAPAMYLANEMNQNGFPFFEESVSKGLVGSDPEFMYMTTVESYWYSRYNMSALTTESRLGVHVVYGPYVSEWALREGRANDNRDRGTFVRPNGGALLQEIVPLYMTRSGFPRRFEDASPTMLQFATGDPHYVRPLDRGVRFESTENILRDKGLGELYGTGLVPRPTGRDRAGNDMWKARINYRENFLSLRWNHRNMDHVIDLGAEGQTLMKMVLWIEYFFRGSHHGGRFLGNDPEEGFRGSMLNLMAVSKMLMLKGALFCDGTRLGGVDPRSVEPGQWYLPHRVRVRMRMAGDMPPRPEEFEVEDPSSRLFDQGSLLWALSEYYHFADPERESPHSANWSKVFGAQTPYDGSVMEQKYLVLAEGLARAVLQNMAAQHAHKGHGLVSEWKPGSGPGQVVSIQDHAMAMLGLANFLRRIPVEPGSRELARRLLQDETDLLADRFMTSDGTVASQYDFGTGRSTGGPPTLLAQAFAVRALLEAHKILGEDRYLEEARRAYQTMNARLWDDATGVYRSEAGASTSVYTPMNLGAALGAMREYILASGDSTEIERYKRFWVQGVNSSGIQQAEYEETGEKDFFAADGDGDGIPRLGHGDGEHGIAPVFASRVHIQTPTSGRPGGSSAHRRRAGSAGDGDSSRGTGDRRRAGSGGDAGWSDAP